MSNFRETLLQIGGIAAIGFCIFWDHNPDRVNQLTEKVTDSALGIEHYEFTLSGPIDTTTVSGVLTQLAEADENDTVTLYIHSPGGSTMDGFAVNYAMRHSKAAHIEAVVTGYAASMAQIIAFGADHITMQKDSWFMIHYGSFLLGKLTIQDKQSPIKFLRDYVSSMDNYVRVQAGNFITPEGWKLIWNGDEYWLSADDFYKFGGDHFNGRKMYNPYIDGMIQAMHTPFNSKMDYIK